MYSNKSNFVGILAWGVQSNKIEQKINRTQSNDWCSIGFRNRTKSNIYFAVSSIFEQNRTNPMQFCSDGI